MYLIDGHNLIGSKLIPDISLDQENDEERLVGYIRARQPALKKSVTIVFDGGIPGGFSATLSGGGVNVTFAAQGRSDADTVILERARAHQRRQHNTPAELVVVTNDSKIRQQAEALGAQVWSAAAFLDRLARPQRHPTARARRLQTEPKLPKSEVEKWLHEFGVIPADKQKKRR